MAEHCLNTEEEDRMGDGEGDGDGEEEDGKCGMIGNLQILTKRTMGGGCRPDSYTRSGSVSLTRNHYEKHVLKIKSNPMSPIYMIAFYMFMYGGVS